MHTSRSIAGQLLNQQLLHVPSRAAAAASKSCRRFHSCPKLRSKSKTFPSRPSTWWQAARRPGPTAVTLLASGGFLSLLFGLSEPSRPSSGRSRDDDRKKPTETQTPTDDRDPTVPRFKLSEIRTHDSKSDKPWVTYEDKVYDISDWVPAHPGGDVILRAAGGSIDTYWDIFAIHKAPHVREILEQYQIGFVDSADLVDGKLPAGEIDDPFKDDPARDSRLITLTERPRNAETPSDELAEAFLTPNELFYVRNHMWVPKLDGDEDGGSYVLTVELLDGTEREYSLRDLKERFTPVRIAATLQCSGNRRGDMTRYASRPAQGIQWDRGAISCALWEGVRLSDVLADAGFPLRAARDGETGGARHVRFSGKEGYGASVPLEPVIDPRGDVVLAYAMNGKPLPRDHGYPLRALVPGHVAARSVKWLKRVVVSDEESESQWQRRDYKLFGPNVTKPDWDTAPAIQEMPVTSAITSVKLGGWVPYPSTTTNPATQQVQEAPNESKQKKIIGEKEADEEGRERDSTSNSSSPSRGRSASLLGYAYSGGGRRIVRVDVSLDSGKTWDQAELVQDCRVPGPDLESQAQGHKSWAWQRWRHQGVIPFGERRGGDEAGHDDRDEGAMDKDDKGTAKKWCSTLLVKATDESYNSQPDGYEGIWNIRGNLANAWHKVQVCSDCEGQGQGQDQGQGEGKGDGRD